MEYRFWLTGNDIARDSGQSLVAPLSPGFWLGGSFLTLPYSRVRQSLGINATGSLEGYIALCRINYCPFSGRTRIHLCFQDGRSALKSAV
jgi:hypothetical protein